MINTTASWLEPILRDALNDVLPELMQYIREQVEDDGLSPLDLLNATTTADLESFCREYIAQRFVNAIEETHDKLRNGDD